MPKNKGFTPLEKASDFNQWSSDSRADGTSMPALAQSARRRSSLTGFTLIQLVIILIIVGIMAVVTVTNMPDMLGMRIMQAAYKIQSDIRFAQRLAMQSQRRTYIVFSVVNDNYSIYVENTYQIGDWAKVKNPLTLKDFDVQLNSEEFKGVDIFLLYFNDFNNDALLFERTGAPFAMNSASGIANPLLDPMGGMVVLNNYQKYIFIKPRTGRVKIENTPTP